MSLLRKAPFTRQTMPPNTYSPHSSAIQISNYEDNYTCLFEFSTVRKSYDTVFPKLFQSKAPLLNVIQSMAAWI